MNANIIHLQGETELSFRLTPSLTRSYTKPRTEQLREEVILVKEDISLKDNSVSYCMYAPTNYDVRMYLLFFYLHEQ